MTVKMKKTGTLHTVIFTAICISACTTTKPPVNQYSTLAKNLASCQIYSETFKHPLTQDTLERRIEGLKGDKCIYVESMPNNGELRCEYPEAMRNVAANYYQSQASTSKSSITIKIPTAPKPSNPLSAALASGVCQISGY